MKFGPKNAEEEVIFAEENLRVDLQHCLQKLLTQNKMTRRELAARAGMTEQQMSQLFSENANPTVRTIARIFHALGDECVLTSRKLEEVEKRSSAPLQGTFAEANAYVRVSQTQAAPSALWWSGGVAANLHSVLTSRRACSAPRRSILPAPVGLNRAAREAPSSQTKGKVSCELSW